MKWLCRLTAIFSSQGPAQPFISLVMKNNNIPLDRSSNSIAIEIVSDEEMALIEAAFSAIGTASRLSLISSSSSSSSQLTRCSSNGRSIESISHLSKRRFSGCSESVKTEEEVDIEDFGGGAKGCSRKKIRGPDSFFFRFRRKRGLSVTDITASEWCEKQMEFVLLHGKPKATEAMKAGSDRHVKLEEEVVQKVKVHVEAVEDAWAVKFMNFIVGVNQLLFEGLTRELPVIGLIQGVWMVGIIDELQMPTSGIVQHPLLVDTKTRSQATLPTEPQKRNGRLQLMCYKYLWDKLTTDSFATSHFYSFFGLNPHSILPEEVKDLAASSGFPVKTLEDLVIYYRNTCCTLPLACDQLLLRYEFQGDNSLLGEDLFTYDPDWLTDRMKCSLEFWFGRREASYVSEDERWKCRFCKFACFCPANASANGEVSSSGPC